MPYKMKVKNVLVTLYIQTYQEDNIDEIDYSQFADDIEVLIESELSGGWVNEITVAGVGVAAELNLSHNWEQ